MVALRGAVIAASLALVLGSAASAASAPDVMPVVVTFPGSVYVGYAPPTVVVNEGASLTYANLDTTEHDFVQDVEVDGFGGSKKAPWCKKFRGGGGHEHGHDHGAAVCPAFYTPLLAQGQATEVQGLASLKPGTYSFFCTKHHSMKGTLIVR